MADKLSASKHGAILQNRIIPDVLGGKNAAPSQPRLVLLGGQPGAGKGGLRADVAQQLADPVEIDIDELRIYHPQYRNFVQADPATAASRVQADCSEWASELFDEAVKRRLDMIYDGTMSVSSKSTDMAKAASKAGFGIEVHVVATSLDVSQQGVNGRFEQSMAAWKDHENDEDAVPPRTVPANIQKGAYDNIPGTLKDLCATGLVSRMRIATRTGDTKCDLLGKAAVRRDGPKQATQALEAERNRPWTQTEIDEYTNRGKSIVAAMQLRNAPRTEIDKVQNAQNGVVEKRKGELQASQTKQDQWITNFVHYDVTNLATIQPLPKKKKNKMRIDLLDDSDEKGHDSSDEMPLYGGQRREERRESNSDLEVIFHNDVSTEEI